jgi:hypothetical protein
MKKICLLILSIMCSITQLMASNDVVITVLDKTKGASCLTFSQLPKIWIAIDGYKRFDLKSIGEKHILNDSVYMITVHTVKPILVDCGWLGDGNRMIITPGDRAKIVAEYAGNDKQKFKICFSGEMKENYNAYRNLKIEFRKNEIWNLLESVSLQKSVKIIDSAYTSKCKMISANIKLGLLQSFMLNEEKAKVFFYLEHANSISRNKLTCNDLMKIKKQIFPFGY